MRNLYQEGENRREAIKYLNDKPKSYFIMDFLNNLIVSIINNYINDINTKTVFKTNSISDIHVNDQINLYSLTSAKDCSINLDRINKYHKKHSFTIPGDIDEFNAFKSFVNKFLSFDINLGTLENNTIILNCSLDDLISEYEHFKYLSGPISSIFNQKLEDESRYAYEINNDLIATIHADLFEKWFLDKILIDLMSNTIKNNITVNEPDKSYEDIYFHKSISIYKESFIKKNYPNTSKDTNKYIISDEYYDLFLQMVKHFMKEYNLGGILDYNGTSVSIEFNTILSNVMDAYYMEKRVIEHNINPNQKAL